MFKRNTVLILLLCLIPTMCGCVALLAGAVGGGGTAVWLSDKLVQDVDASFDKSINASKSALRSLRLDVTKETKKDNVAQIKSRYTDGKTVWIDVHKVTRSTSRVEVRVGALGDEEAARKILDKILRYL